jgi:hypothetical protein
MVLHKRKILSPQRNKACIIIDFNFYAVPYDFVKINTVFKLDFGKWMWRSGSAREKDGRKGW